LHSLFDISKSVSHIHKQLLSWKSRSICSIIWILVKFWYAISTTKVIMFLAKQNIQWWDEWLILFTKILAMKKRTSHSSHHWIFCLIRNMMTFLVYFAYQNFTRINMWHIILQMLLLFQDHKSFISSLNVLFSKEHDDFCSW
jgi:hypothetical protein